MYISENLKKIQQSVPAHVMLVAVSKTKPNTDIQEAYDAGQRVFGENKIQEMTGKYNDLPKDIKWHMIGHLQRNKIKYMAHYVDLIHGISNLKTLIEVNKQAKKYDRVINCLLQVKIAEEDSKFGLSFAEVTQILFSEEIKELSYINIQGLMGMSSFTSDENQVKQELSSLNSFYSDIKDKIVLSNINIQTLSMGMSGDYQLAIDCGSTMVRVGSAIFGNRNYF